MADGRPWWQGNGDGDPLGMNWQRMPRGGSPGGGSSPQCSPICTKCLMGNPSDPSSYVFVQTPCPQPTPASPGDVGLEASIGCPKPLYHADLP